MANRLTQEAREVLQQGGNPNARLTQVATETLQRANANANVRLTQTAREVLVRLSIPVATAAQPIMFVIT
jgi:hypothetical protein